MRTEFGWCVQQTAGNSALTHSGRDTQWSTKLATRFASAPDEEGEVVSVAGIDRSLSSVRTGVTDAE